MELRWKSRGSDFPASRRPTKQWNEMNTVARSTWDMFSNSAAGRFTTAVTPSDTKEWQKNCGPSEQTSRSFPLTDGPQFFCRSEEHTSELQSHHDLVCRLLLEKKKQHK